MLLLGAAYRRDQGRLGWQRLIVPLDQVNARLLRIQLFSGSNSNAPNESTDSMATDASAPNAKSVRRLLKDTPLDKSILAQLDAIRLGSIKKRQIKGIHKSFEPGFRANHSPQAVLNKVFPFKKHGQLLQSMTTWEESKMHIVGNPPQVAIIGRSNVGKSTLVNALLGFNDSFLQKAAVSDKPGETRQLTFYRLGKLPLPPNTKSPQDKNEIKSKSEGANDHSSLELDSAPALVIVDMPGYGFAYMNKEDQQRCQDLCFDYLLKSQFDSGFKKTVKRVLLVLDARHFLKEADKEFLNALDERMKQYRREEDTFPKKLSWHLQVVLTKCDLVERLELSRRIVLLKNLLQELVPPRLLSELPIIPVSGLERKGIDTLQKELSRLVPALPTVTEKVDENQLIEVEKKLEKLVDLDDIKRTGAPQDHRSTKGSFNRNYQRHSHGKEKHFNDEKEYSVKKDRKTGRFTPKSNSHVESWDSYRPRADNRGFVRKYDRKGGDNRVNQDDFSQTMNDKQNFERKSNLKNLHRFPRSREANKTFEQSRTRHGSRKTYGKKSRRNRSVSSSEKYNEKASRA